MLKGLDNFVHTSVD